MIQVEHLKKTYVGKKHALSRGLVDVSFTLPATGFVFVLGKSGSGKSTLLNLLGALDDKTDGKILIEGKEISIPSPRKSSIRIALPTAASSSRITSSSPN